MNIAPQERPGRTSREVALFPARPSSTYSFSDNGPPGDFDGSGHGFDDRAFRVNLVRKGAYIDKVVPPLFHAGMRSSRRWVLKTDEKKLAHPSRTTCTASARLPGRSRSLVIDRDIPQAFRDHIFAIGSMTGYGKS